MKLQFEPAIHCDKSDRQGWKSIRECIRNKQSKYCNDCQFPIDCYIDIDFWICPSCNHTFKQHKIEGHLINAQLDSSQINGDIFIDTKEEMPQSDSMTCPYCGFRAVSYDTNAYLDIIDFIKE